MGLGKTCVILKVLEKIKVPALIFAPLKTITTTWPDEIAMMKKPLTYQILHGEYKDWALKQKADIYLINPDGAEWLYNALARMYKETKKFPFEALVIDEGSRWKSNVTNRFIIIKILLQLFTSYRFILSGTPAPEGLLGLWSQYYILDEGKTLGDNFNAYRKKYFLKNPYCDHVYELANPQNETKILNTIAPITFRLDSADYLNLPECVYSTLKIELSTKLQTEYKTLEKTFLLDTKEYAIKSFNKLSLSSKLRQFIQGAIYIDDKRNYKVIHDLKVQALNDFVELTDEPVLCAIQFKFELDLLRVAFPDAPFIVGGGSLKNATRIMNEWNAGKHKLLIVHPDTVSHGTNMQFGGHIVFWFALTWSLETYLQLIKRLHRSGQKHTVSVVHLCIKNTIDEYMAAQIQKKDVTQTRLLQFLKEYDHESN
jgi:SNF2 family DNA or RNA helicase